MGFQAKTNAKWWLRSTLLHVSNLVSWLTNLQPLVHSGVDALFGNASVRVDTSCQHRLALPQHRMLNSNLSHRSWGHAAHPSGAFSG